MPRTVADAPLILSIPPSKVNPRRTITRIEALFDAVHQDQQSGGVLRKLWIKSHEIPVERIFIVFANKESAWLLIEIEHTTPQPSFVCRNSQRFQGLEVGLKPGPNGSLICLCGDLFDLFSQFSDFIFMAVTVDVGHSGKLT